MSDEEIKYSRFAYHPAFNSDVRQQRATLLSAKKVLSHRINVSEETTLTRRTRICGTFTWLWSSAYNHSKPSPSSQPPPTAET